MRLLALFIILTLFSSAYAADAPKPARKILATVSKVIGPTGGSVTLSGYATVRFPAGALPEAQNVQVSATVDAEAEAMFREEVEYFHGGIHVGYELRVKVGSTQPRDDIEVTFTVPEDFRSQLPKDADIRGFVQALWVSEDEWLDGFMVTPRLLSATAESATFTIDRGYFTDGRDTDGLFESVVILGSTLN